MKTALDPRHQKRIQRMQSLFSYGFYSSHIDENIADIIKHLPEIDQKLQKAAPEWPIEKISKIDLAILRLAIWELTDQKKAPPKVIIDEAVELAKEFGNPNSSKFINGALATLMVKE